MRVAALMFVLAWQAAAAAQELTGAERQRVLETARSRYYSLTGLGVKSFTCGVKFDLGTLSKGMLPETDAADRALLESAAFALKETPNGPMVRYQFPEGSVSQSQEIVGGVTLWITELVQGFFQAWTLKGFRGPIPPDKEVQSVTREGDGYRVTAKVARQSSEILLGEDLLVREIVTRGGDGQVDERPAFVPSPKGMVFSGNQTEDKDSSGVTQVRYGVEQGPVNGVLLPRQIHLSIGQHVDVQFVLRGCTVQGKR